MDLDLDLDSGVDLDLDQKSNENLWVFLFIKTLKKPCVVCTCYPTVSIWLEVCVSSGNLRFLFGDGYLKSLILLVLENMYAFLF